MEVKTNITEAENKIKCNKGKSNSDIDKAKEIEKKMFDLIKYANISKFNNFTLTSFDGKLKQANLVTKSALDKKPGKFTNS